MRSQQPQSRSAPKKVRCAIYSRVSTDQGLDQEFNSLDAQREASEAYIKSQAHEGWICLKQSYDDGGFSGGSIERPALQQLLEDVRHRKLDVIVVYKVDRLTRSLADFAKLVELFDAHGVSFVSVTQSFNTTSSMGRLTLNVLLSFAQFEREVTGERIRDKFAASKKKGMFMGGVVPLGYRLGKRELLVDPAEAETVRLIFAQYLEVNSLPKLAIKLSELGIISRVRFLKGKTIGGQPFRTGALSHLLGNRIYIGEVRHHKQHFRGEHEPIVERSVFDAVQEKLALRLNRKNTSTNPSKTLLSGLLHDSRGHLMVATHANKAGVRYCYYQSWLLAHGRKHEAGVVSRVPAFEIEEAIKGALRLHLIESTNPEGIPTEQAEVKHALNSNPTTACKDEDNTVQPIDIHEHVEHIKVLTGEIRITLKPQSSTTDHSTFDVEEPRVLNVLWTKSRTLKRKELQSAEANKVTRRTIRVETRARLLKSIAQGRIWLNRLIQDQALTTDKLATEHKLSERSVRSTLSLAFLAPDIIEAAITSDLPRVITVSQMMDLPTDWNEQRRALGLT